MKLLKCDMLHCEHFYFDAIRCAQDAEVVLKLTEEVNATLRNKVSCLFFSFLVLSFCCLFLFSMLSFSWTSVTDKTHRYTNIFLWLSSPHSSQAPVNTELVRCLSRTARGTLPPLAAAVGGLASQEVLKAITGKFAPLQQLVGHTSETNHQNYNSTTTHKILCHFITMWTTRQVTSGFISGENDWWIMTLYIYILGINQSRVEETRG